ncbi:MFS transporter [Parafannyhessea umbonata]|uniref:MFS transporter n=1 Tax=Parafannyhessea umbonata TaxID=604330 RepID=UPI00359C6451
MTRRTDSIGSRGLTILRLALLVLLGFSLGCAELIVIGIQTNLAHDLGVSIAQTGQLVSLFALLYAIMTPVLALSTGRFRRYSLMLVYLALFCVGNVMSAFATSFGVLLAARMLLGSISGALLAVGVTFIPELAGPRRSSLALTLVYSSYSVALIVSTSMGKILASTVGWHVAMYGTLAFSVVTSVLLALLMPRTGQTDEPATFAEQARLLREPSVLTGILVFVFGIGSVYTFYGYVTPYLEQVLGMGTAQVSETLLVYGAITFVSNLMSGWLDARFGLKSLFFTFLAQAVALAGMFVVGSAMPAALVFVMVIALLMYLVSIPSVSNFMRVSRERHPKALTLASSLEPLSFNIGISFGTLVGGAVVSGPGIRAIGLVGAVLALAAAAMVAVTVRLGRRRG